MRKLISFSSVYLVLLLLTSCSEKRTKITYVDLLNRMTDIESLAILPEKGENCKQWSSWDRRSIFNDSTGMYENWSANGDGTKNYLRMQGESMVLAEMKGPGSIVRIWSAQPENGHVKIYIDEQSEPAVDLPFIQYFDQTVFPFNKEGITYKVASGFNNYLPISYNKSCKVVADSGWGIYYHINYITFPQGTEVQPFSMELDSSSALILDKVNDFFENRLEQSPYETKINEEKLIGEVTVRPGENILIADLKGSRAIKSFRIFPDFKSRTEATIGLRELLLQMDWDEKSYPEVWSPLGDFFGTTPAINPFQTITCGMTDSMMYSYWYMPFSQQATIKIENTGTNPYSFAYEIIHEPVSNIKKYGRFHAKWHGDIGGMREDRWPDWELLKTQGRGRFVGVMLHVINPTGEDCIPFAKDGYPWWGEGDEKFFVDGEKFPGTFGTGTEDYFGYAWGDPSLFNKPYHSQSMSMNNIGHQTLSRWHITDNIPFQTEFEASIEKYYPNDCGTHYNTVVYWYLSAGGADRYKPVYVKPDFLLLPPEIQVKNNLCLQGENIEVSLTPGNDIIYYTIDGSEPDENSNKYEKPLLIKTDCLITARQFDPVNKIWSRSSKAKLQTVSWQQGEADVQNLEPGLEYQYFEEDIVWTKVPDYSILSPVKEGVVPMVDLSMGHREDQFGVQYIGYIEIKRDGVYRFFLNSDDGSRLWINGNLIINNDKNHGFIELSGRAALMKGYHKLLIDYYDNELYQGISFSMEKEGIKKQLVPADILSHEKK